MFDMLIRKNLILLVTISSASDYYTNKRKRGPHRATVARVFIKERERNVVREGTTLECVEQKFPSLRCHQQPPRASQRRGSV